MSSTQTFSAVASHIVGQYSEIGKLLVGTYRTGAQRLVNGANARYASFLNGRTLPLVNERVKTSLIDAQNRIAGALVGSIEKGTGRAEQAIDLLSGGVNAGIERAASAAGRVEAALNTSAITTVGQLTLPVAQVSLTIVNRAVEGTKLLSTRVLGAEDDAVAATAPVVRRAKRAVPATDGAKRAAVRATKRASAKVDAAKSEVKQTVKRTARRVKSAS